MNADQKKEISDILSKVDKEHDVSLSPFDMFRREHIVKTFILLLNW